MDDKLFEIARKYVTPNDLVGCVEAMKEAQRALKIELYDALPSYEGNGSGIAGLRATLLLSEVGDEIKR